MSGSMSPTLCAWWAELRGIEQAKHHRAGWSRAAFAERFGHPPAGPEPEPVLPSPAVCRWARNRGARWARAKMREGAA